jgi:SOS-response transcriptional repressor LexA
MQNETPPARITSMVSETRIELVRVQIDNLWRRLDRPPTIREISRACGGISTSQVNAALRELDHRGEVTLERRGNQRRLSWLRGLETERERTVRELAEKGMLAVSVDVALKAVEWRRQRV